MAAGGVPFTTSVCFCAVCAIHSDERRTAGKTEQNELGIAMTV